MASDKIKVTWDEIDSSSPVSNAGQNKGACINISQSDLDAHTGHAGQNQSAFPPYNNVTGQIPPKTKSGVKLSFIIIPAVIVFIALLAAASVFVYYTIENRYCKPIEAVLSQDALTPHAIPDDIDSPTEMLKMLVQNMRAIDLSKCPQDFQDAYQKHIEAIEQALPIVQQTEEQDGWESFFKNLFIGFVSGYTGHYELLAGSILSDIYADAELGAAAEKVDKDIQSSYLNLLQIAQKYKADTTPYTKP